MLFHAIAAVPLVVPGPWYRVDDPDYPDALARSRTGAILAAPPTDGTRWRVESVPELDEVVEPGDDGGDPARLTNADLWHADGVTGAGVKVAVFDTAWYLGDSDPDVVGDVITHDCWLTPSCETPFDPLRPHEAGEGGHHGWACAEAIRRVAPDVELHAVRADSFTLYEDAVDWAVRNGIDVISMSMSYYNDSMYDGSGPHDAPMRELEDAGVILVKSAGNDGVLHWGGPFVDADHDGRLDGDAGDAVSLWLDKSSSIYVSWNQFGDACGDTDLDVVVTDLEGNRVGGSATRQVPVTEEGQTCKPVDVAKVNVAEEGWFRVEVVLVRGARAGLEVQMFARTGAFEHYMVEGSVSDPASHPLAASVGAVRATTYFDGPLESYSSRGPTRTGVPKPEIVGPDGLSGAAYGPAGFYGTSASTPVVAGLVALVLADDPALSSRQAFQRLQGWAHLPTPRDGETWGGYGAGVARLPVREPGSARCGERPLWLGVWLGPWWWRRSRGVVR